MEKQPEIYCPKCEYKPVPEDRWSCVPSCGTSWHTFWTRGLCPGCGYNWQQTQCPACGRHSPHRAWYHTPADMSQTDEEKRTEPVTA
jgi:hypothetical protein